MLAGPESVVEAALVGGTVGVVSTTVVATEVLGEVASICEAADPSAPQPPATNTKQTAITRDSINTMVVWTVAHDNLFPDSLPGNRSAKGKIIRPAPHIAENNLAS
jgi:hypothetical protein